MTTEPEKVIERHHYNNPSQSQLQKALYQYLADNGVTEAKLAGVIQQKIEQVVDKIVSNILGSKRFDNMIVAAVCHAITANQKAFDNSNYGGDRHILDLVKSELQKLVLSEYEVTIKKRGE